MDTLHRHSKASPAVSRPDGRKRPYQVDVQNGHSECPDKRSSHHEELPERNPELPVENRQEAGTSTEQGTSASRKHDQKEAVPVQAAAMTLRSPTSDALNGRSRRTAKVDVQAGARCKPKRVGEGQISLLRPLAPVHGANPTKLFKCRSPARQRQERRFCSISSRRWVKLEGLTNDKNYYFSLAANYEKGASEPVFG